MKDNTWSKCATTLLNTNNFFKICRFNETDLFIAHIYFQWYFQRWQGHRNRWKSNSFARLQLHFYLNMQQSLFKYFCAPFHNICIFWNFFLHKIYYDTFFFSVYFSPKQKKKTYKIHVYFDSYWLISVKQGCCKK